MASRYFLGNLLVLAVLAAACGDDETGPSEERFASVLSGAGEVPAVATSASGSASLKLRGSTMDVTVSVSNLGGAFAVHIHGPATTGQEADPVVGLPIADGVTSGTLASVTGATATSLRGLTVMKGTVSFDSALVLIRKGLAYINVHTEANPDGEIRGHIGKSATSNPDPPGGGGY
ncbi:MAG: CHRD domain-containing protein [Gemmatimonadetes bacterium]|nr:CHRD domain-containing protein [Gemmatimonadota bacterium]